MSSQEIVVFRNGFYFKSRYADNKMPTMSRVSNSDKQKYDLPLKNYIMDIDCKVLYETMGKFCNSLIK